MMRLAILLAVIGGEVAIAEIPKQRSPDHVRGRELWEQSCWQCHGATAEGDGPSAEALTVDVPSLRGTVTIEGRDRLINTIIYGQGLMPAYGETFDRPEARRILAFLQRLETMTLEQMDEELREDAEEDEEEEVEDEEESEEEEVEGNAPEVEATEPTAPPSEEAADE
jgi:mono/diheme cytochrome c family protein